MRWLDCKLIKATLCLLTHSHTLNRFKKHKLITYPHSPIPVIIPMIKDPRQSRPNIKVRAQDDHLIKTTNCQWKMGKEGATSWFLGPFISFSTLLCVIMDTTCGKHSIHFTPIKKREWFHCNRVGIELRTSERLSELLRRTELCKSYCFSK